MKIISPDNYGVNFHTTGVYENYPISNLENDYPRKITKANGNTLDISISITSGANVVGIANTNATTISWYVRTGPKGIDWETNSSAIDWNAKTRGVVWQTSSAVESDVDWDVSGSTLNDIWIDYTQQNVAHAMDITLTDSGGDDLYVGVMRAGFARVYRDPYYGITETSIDNSYVEKMASGGYYIKKREKNRRFSLRLYEDRDTDFYELMYTVLGTYGPGPLFWRITTKTNTDMEMVVYAICEQYPMGSHLYPDDSTLEIILTEML